MKPETNGPHQGAAIESGTVSQSIGWFSQGEERIVEVADFKVIIRFVGRNGRRARISIVAPAGALFSD